MNTPSINSPAAFANSFNGYIGRFQIPTMLVSVQGNIPQYAMPRDSVTLVRPEPLVRMDGSLLEAKSLYGTETGTDALDRSDLFFEWKRLQRLANDVAKDVGRSSTLEDGNKFLRIQAGDSFRAAQMRKDKADDRIELSLLRFNSALYYAALDSDEDKRSSLVEFILVAQLLESVESLWMASAMVSELAADIALSIDDEVEANQMYEGAAKALLESIADYSDPASLGMRIARGLWYSHASGADDVATELLHASADYNDEYDRPVEAAHDLVRLVNIMLAKEGLAADEWSAIGSHMWSSATLIGDIDGNEDTAAELAWLASAAEEIASNP